MIGLRPPRSQPQDASQELKVRRAMYDELSHQRRRGLLRLPGELLQVWRERRATA